jgi:hypothetical protein
VTGASGATGATGAGGGFTITPTLPARTLNTTFTPSPTNNVFCAYTLELVGTVAAGTDVQVELRSDAASPPTTVRASARLALVGTSGDLLRSRQVLSYIVPPGDNVQLTVVTAIGPNANAILETSSEEIFS